MLDRAWLPFNRDGPARPAGRRHLVCLPFAGGGASNYARWLRLPACTFDVLPVQLPGREHRIADVPYRSMDGLLDALMDSLICDLPNEVVLFGHSMGALIATRLAFRMEAAGRPLAGLCVSGFPPPDFPRTMSNLHTLPKDEMLEQLGRLNGLRPEVLANPELIELILPTLYADLMLEEQDAPVSRGQLACPISLFSGVDDPLLPEAAIEAWNDMTAQALTIHRFDGDHFFILNMMNEIISLIEYDFCYAYEHVR